LTYNLYATERIGGPLQYYPTVNPEHFPLAAAARDLLADKGFLPEVSFLTLHVTAVTNDDLGGTMGVYCTHRYAHAHQSAASLMPYALKGVDYIMLSVFRSLGLITIARPVLENKLDEWWDDHDHRYDPDYDEDIDPEEYELRHRPVGSIVGDNFVEIKSSNEDGCDQSYEEKRQVLSSSYY
jgi:hypothetical protein